jgi:serine/threonine-protein kinase
VSIIGHTLVGRYKVLSLLGKGGMGAVYEAEQLDLHRRVAIKVLKPGAEPEQLLRFKQEALAAAGLAHPNIVQVLDFVDGAEPLLVMELLRGRSLTALVKANGKLGPTRAIAIMTQVLSALAAAHDARIVHRDVKPENIFVCESALPYELVKVLDFGLARPLDESRHIARTRAGIALGTPAYMAPEQARGGAADVRMDVFAAGVTLYYALAGRRPFEGKTTSELVRAVSKQPPLPLDALCPDLDLDLVRVVERALSKDPKARFASAGTFLDALTSKTLPAAEHAPAKAAGSSHVHDTTAGTRKRAPARRGEPDASALLSELEVRSPAVAVGMVAFARFAPDGASALALGPSGLARWTLGEGWSARELPPGITAAHVRGVALGGQSALLFGDTHTYVRERGVFSAVDVPPGLLIHGAHLDEHIVLAGTMTKEGVIVELVGAGRRPVIHHIGRGISLHGVTRARNGAPVACGTRGTVCVIDDGGRVHAHVAGRSTLAAIAPLGDGFVAVGTGGAIVHAPGATSDAIASATETHFVDDDLVAIHATGKLFCAVGKRVHVASVDALGRPLPVGLPGIVRDAWVGEGTIRILLDSAAVLEGRLGLGEC